MPSLNYLLFREAILEQKQVICVYDGLRREICPVILGRKGNEEKALVFQFGGASSQGLPPGGAWKCLALSKVTRAAVRAGPWHEGQAHSSMQRCVDDVDLDVNIHVRHLR
jgi:hypothetical protein